MGDSLEKDRACLVLVAVAFSGRDQNVLKVMLNIANVGAIWIQSPSNPAPYIIIVVVAIGISGR
ncbi:hypothetical protein TIFTF001_012797 [Ficus carica]|uniref:Uncharacterized protein n=1 Tax=Ficus carica TaxID=3494 RepID=A0AA88ANU8_FICCA|nr:hypothetical protein TIFTF001_012797 [Ficus carica]